MDSLSRPQVHFVDRYVDVAVPAGGLRESCASDGIQMYSESK